jgi:hypothetical protein
MRLPSSEPQAPPRLLRLAFLKTLLGGLLVVPLAARAQRTGSRVQGGQLTTPERVKKLEEELAELQAGRQRFESDLRSSLQAKIGSVAEDLAKTHRFLETHLPPVGTILAYTGALKDLPESWVVCDGTRGTPNLSGKFLRGVQPGEPEGALGKQGGRDRIPDHYHEIDGKVTEVTMPEDNTVNALVQRFHPPRLDPKSVPDTGRFWFFTEADVKNPFDHGHNNGTGVLKGVTKDSSTGALDNRPEFVSVSYIMRIA